MLSHCIFERPEHLPEQLPSEFSVACKYTIWNLERYSIMKVKSSAHLNFSHRVDWQSWVFGKDVEKRSIAVNCQSSESMQLSFQGMLLGPAISMPFCLILTIYGNSWIISKLIMIQQLSGAPLQIKIFRALQMVSMEKIGLRHLLHLNPK